MSEPSYKIECPTGLIADAKIIGPDGKPLSQAQVVTVTLDANHPFATARVVLSRVAVDVRVQAAKTVIEPD